MKKALLLSLLLSAFHAVQAQYIVAPVNAGRLDTLRESRKNQSAANISNTKLITREAFEGLSWLEGIWAGIDSTNKFSTEEKWERKTTYMLSGIRASLSGKDTTNKQRLDFIYEVESYYYWMLTDSNKRQTYYGIAYLSSNGFILEKTDPAFPSKIVYGRIGKRLRVTLSGNGRTESYFCEQKELN